MSPKKYSKQSNPWDLAQAHYNYAQQIPGIIEQYIVPEVRQHLSHEMVHNPIGGIAVMHTHNTLPNMSQKYKLPIWEVPNCDLNRDDRNSIRGNAASLFYSTKGKYEAFAEAVLERIATLDE